MNSLFTFEAAARHGNFSKAAAELNVTPAAVSRMISRLEKYLDTTLFIRQPGGVSLTELGKLLFDAIAQGFSVIGATLREIQERQTGIETVSLSVSTGFTTHWLMPRMARFKQAFPGVDLRFQLVMGALSGPVNDVDLGMRFMAGPDDRHDAVFVMPEILVPICSPAYRKTHDGHGKMSRTPNTTISLSDAEPDWSSLFSPAGEGEPVNSMIFSDYAIVVQAALLGQGVALGWLNVVAHWLRLRALVPAGSQIMKTERQCHLVRLREKPARPVVMQVRDWLIAELDDDVRAVDALYPGLDLGSRLPG